MTTFEENTNETIEKIVRNLDTMTKSIVDLYGKIEELNKSIDRVVELINCENECSHCNGSGLLEVEPGAYITCYECDGTGKIKLKEDA